VSPVSASADLVRRSVAQLADSSAAVARPKVAPARRGEERPSLQVVPGAGRRANRRLWVATAMVLAFFVFFGLAVFQTMLVENQQQLDRLDKQVAAEQTTHAGLALETARAESPQHIVDQATKLGMVPAVDRKYLPPSPAAAAAGQAAGGEQGSATGDEDNGAPVADQSGVKASLGNGR
jgi:hypothetical protein